MSKPAETTLAFVLRKVDYGESDRIITLFTRDHGKLSARARAARKSTKRFGGALEPFVLMEVTLRPGRGAMWQIAEARPLAPHEGLGLDLARLGAAAHIVELIREVLPEHEPERELFATLAETLGLLESASGTAIRAAMISATLEVLRLTGTGLGIDRCSVCGTPVPETPRPLRIDPARGGVVCTPCGGGPLGLGREAAAALVELSARPLRDSAAVTLSEESAEQIEAIVDTFAERHLGKALRSTAFRAQVGARRR